MGGSGLKLSRSGLNMNRSECVGVGCKIDGSEMKRVEIDDSGLQMSGNG